MPKAKRQSNPDEITQISIEYTALRDEILKRIELRYQIIYIVLIVAGSFLGAGVQFDGFSSALLIYPIVSSFIFLGWGVNENEIRKISGYIREHIESKMEFLNYHSSVAGNNISSGNHYAFMGITVFTQILSIIISLSKTNFYINKFSIADQILLEISSGMTIVIVIVWLAYSVRLMRESRKH